MLGLQSDKKMLVICGPTGVGKSDLAIMAAEQIPAEIINADMGQLYKPFSVGTAKPMWRSQKAPHHLFDVMEKAENCTVVEYRDMLIAVLNQIWARGNLPIVVGGSGFYVQSIFFPPAARHTNLCCQGTWDELYAVDKQRALSIHPHDTYRITRALSIWYASGVKPSEFVRRFEPLAQSQVVWCYRNRAQLHERIDERTSIMLNTGWIEECQQIIGTEWEEFVRKKKLIGYVEICDYLKGNGSLKAVAACIAQKTRAYAKRQETFWRMLKKSLESEKEYQDYVSCKELNLTLSDPYLYINQLSQSLKSTIR